MPSAERAEVDLGRRRFLAAGGISLALFQVGLIDAAVPESAAARDAFLQTTLEDAVAALGGVPVGAEDIDLTVPETVEDGTAVPISVSSALPNVEAIYILVDVNPLPLAVGFSIPAGTEPFVSIRLKFAQSGAVYAVVRAGGELYSARKDTRVTRGGCT